jgi:hypothetical protein
MYLHEALRATDNLECLKAMEEEVNSHVEKSKWTIMNRADVPSGQLILPANET